MGARTAHHAFHLAGGVDQRFEVTCRFVEFLKIRYLIQRFGDADRLARDGGDQLGRPVHFCQGDVHDARHVPDGRPRPHGAKGDDLGNLIVAVLAGGVLQHLGAHIIAEIQVDIRH